MTHPVFVYGSLKTGFYNHSILMDGNPTLIGPAITLRPFLMEAGAWFPFLIDPTALRRKAWLAGLTGRVVGELYHVDDDTMDRLDDLEGHPDFYRREPVDVRVSTGGVFYTDTAWIYLLQGDLNPLARYVMPNGGGVLEWTADMIRDLAPADQEE